jgi:hypothetical protein
MGKTTMLFRTVLLVLLLAAFRMAGAATDAPQVVSGIATKDGSFGMYLAFDLAEGAEPKRPENVRLMLSENYVARFAGKVRKSAKLVDVKNCQHAPDVFEKFHQSAFGSFGKNDFKDVLPIALKCDDLSFMFLLYRTEAMTEKTVDSFEQRARKRFDWQTRKVAAVWWASSRDMIPLEDLSSVKDAAAMLTAKLK